ncbi:MAG: hypothetical protein QXW00_04490 [Candidatus Woesearchaeota archaeon]
MRFGRGSRKGESAWIAWVMITAFMVVMGALIYKWSSSYAAASAEQVEENAYRENCRDVSVNIKEACQDNYTLTLNIENVGSVNVDKVIINMFDAFGYGASREQMLRIKPGLSSMCTFVKQYAISTVKVVPAIRVKNKWIVCSEREVEFTGVKYC